MRRPDIKEYELRGRTRLALFWFTIAVIVVVAVMAVVTIVRLWNKAQPEALPLTVTPAEVSLCPGETQQFAITAGDASWETTGGTVTDAGLFTAGSNPGDYQVVAHDAESGQEAQARVHVQDCNPTAVPTPVVTATPTVAPSPTPEAAAAAEDAQGDVLTYEGGVPAESVPAGIDIRAASIGPGLSLQLEPSSATPSELLSWVQEGETLLWITTYEPIPDDVYPYWVFALDTDANTETGRPAGSARINPDMGDEATVNLYYDSNKGEYVAELSVWSPAQGDWVVTTQPVRYIISESRTVIGMALSLDGLTAEVAQTSNVTVVPGNIRARAAALSYAGQESVIDFYPDRPE